MKSNFKKIGILVFVLIQIAKFAQAQTFTSGNLAVFQAAASSTNTTGAILELNAGALNSSPVNTYSIDGTSATTGLRFSGSATSTGYLANSNDGSLLAITGHLSNNTSANANTLTTRAVATLNSSYTFSIATSYTGSSGNQTRCATSLNNTGWYIADQGGLYTNSATIASPTGNFRGAKSFGGIVYLMTASTTSPPVGTVSSITGSTYSSLPGLANGSASKTDFYLISSGSNGSTYDVLYILENSSATAGVISKYSLVSGSWSGNGTYTTTFGGFGLAVNKSGSGASLYVTTGTGASLANSVIRLTDAAGYNATINITTSNNLTLYTAPTGTILKGIAFAPSNPCTTPSITSITSNSPICAGSALNLQLTIGGSAATAYSWTGPNSFTSTSQSPTISNSTTAATGTYNVTVTNACGTTTSSVSATVNANPTASISASGATTFCSGNSVTLTASGGSTYLWSTGATTSSINVTSSGNYTVQATQNNCSNTSSATTVTVYSLVTPSVSITSSSGNVICNGNSKTFTATPTNGGASPAYQWKVNGNNVGSNQSTYSTNTLLDGDVVTCSMTSNATCPSIVTVTSNAITVSQTTVVASETFGSILCYGGTTSITVSGSGGTSPYAGTGSFTVSAGTYNYIVTDANGCSGEKSVVVTEPATLVASESHSAILCNGGSSTVTISGNGGTSPYSGIGNFSQNAGSNSYLITDANGCTSSVTATVSQPSALQISETHGAIIVAGGTANVSISASGGTAPYTGTGSFSQAAGSTTYTVTDANGCSASTTVILTQPSALNISETHDDIKCYGGSTSVTISVSGGTAPYTGEGTFTQSAEDILYTVTDANGVTGSILVSLTQPSSLTISTSNSSILCNGGTSTVTVTANGGTAPYSGDGLFSVSAGSYNYIVTDLNGCTATKSVIINEPAFLSASETHDSILCNGGSTIIAITAAGGTTPYAGVTNYTVNAGSYNYTVTDANGCSTIKNITVSEPALLVASELHSSILCNGNNSTVTISANGGVQPYIGTGNFTQTSGTQQYSVTDANGCIANVSATITEPTILTINATNSAIECAGGSSTVTIIASGGVAPYVGTGTFSQVAGTYNYEITDANGCSKSTTITIQDGVTPSISSFSPAVGLPGSFVVITGVGFTGATAVKINGINSIYTINSDVQITATVPIGSGAGVIEVIKNTCSGLSSINFGITSVTELVVPRYIGSKTAASTNNSRTPVAFCVQIDNLLPSTLYNLTAQIGLTTEASTAYGAGNVWNGTAYSGSQILNAFTTNASGSSGPVWFYIQPTGNATRFDAGVAHNPRISFYTGAVAPTNPMYAFTKTITPLDIASTARTASTADDGAYLTGSLDSCMSGKIVLIYDTIAGNVNPLYAYPAVSNLASTYSSSDFTGTLAIVNQVYLNTSAKGSFVGVIPIGANNNGRGVRRIETRDLQNNILNSITDADGVWPSGGNTTTVLKRGLVSLTNSDASLNTISSLSVSNVGVACYGASTGSATALAVSSANPISYSWNGGTYTTATINNLSAATFTIIASDANGCRKSGSTVVSSPSQLTISTSLSPIACNGGNATITVSANGGTQPYAGTGSYIVAAGTYNYTVTDTNGCTASKNLTISEPSSLSVNSTVDSINCNGGSATINISASGGTSPYTGIGAFTSNAGPYNYVVTDANGCTKSLSGVLTEPSALAASESHTNVNCFEESSTVTITASGGVSPYFGTGDFSQSTTNQSYTITDANGCTSTVTATVSIPTQLTLSETHGTIGISGGSTTVNISATGGTAPYAGAGSFTQSAGIVNYTVTDANNCSTQITVALTEPSQLSVTETHSPILCNGGSTDVTINVSGGVAPYSGIGVFSQSVGTVIYSVTDANGATGSIAVSLTQPTAVSTSESHTFISCFGDSSIVTVSAIGGVTPYSGTGNYKVTAGTYTFTVTDNNGCSSTISTVVNQPSQLVASSIVAGSPCQGASTSVTINGSGGTTPYTGVGSFNQSNGTNNYTITDAYGCFAFTSATVVEQNNVTPSITISANSGTTICAGSASTIHATISNGGPSPIFNWKLNGQSVGSLDSLTSSSFLNGDIITCELTSNATCANPVTVTSNLITMNVTTVNASITVAGSTSICPGDSILLTASIGDSFLWSTGATANSIYVNNIGNYLVTVTNSNCSATSNVVQIQNGSSPAQPGGIVTASTAILKGQTGVAFSVLSVNSVQYVWTYSGTGVTISGSGNAITIDFASNATSGTLNVYASNACGSSVPQNINLNLLSTSFTDGNIVALQTYTTVSKSSSPVTLKEFTKSGVVSAVVNLPSTGSNAIQSAGVYGGSEGFITTSSDNRYITIAGYNTAGTYADITGTTATSVPRVVGKVTPSGNYLPIASSTTFYNLNDIRGAVSDGTNFWASGASTASIDGINYFGPGAQVALATGAVPPKAYGLRIFNGEIYYSTQKAGPNNSASQLGIFKLGTGLPTSGTVTVSSMINTGTNLPQDFSFNPSMDVCYVAISSNTSAGGIQKWTKSASTWTLAYTLGTGATNIGAYGLVVDYSGANPVLFATTFETLGNRIIKITDTGSSSTASTIVPAITGVFNKGITFAPVDAGTPTVAISLSKDTIKEAGTTSLNIIATASSTVAGNQQVKVSLSGLNITNGDYTLTDTLITIPNGSSSGYVTVTAIDDTLNEGNEIVVAQISNPTSGILIGSYSSVNFIIKDNDANTAPSIAMDSSTTNYIDGSITVNYSPFGLSSVVNDPTDPVATSGVNFRVFDLESADSLLVVTATSNNLSVVPLSGLIISGSNAIRTLKIIPIFAGYTTITVSVSDGNLSTNYIINYAASLPNPTIDTAKTFFHTGMSDGSVAIPIDANYYIAGDDELNLLNVYSRNHSGLPARSFNYTSYLSLPDPAKPEVDVEAGTRGFTYPNRIYWSGSMSNGKLPFDNKPNRDRLFATDVTKTGDSTMITFVGYYNLRNALKAWGDTHGYDFTASMAAGVDSKGLAGFSLEGMVMAPDSTTMYLGLRAPLVPTSYRHNAVIVPIQNFETWFNNGNPSGNPTLGNPIEMDLDVRGIRDITRLSNGTYVIVAGSPIEDGGVNNIYKWSGYADEAPVPVSNIVGGILNIEGIMQGVDSLGSLNNSTIQVISDGGALILYQDSIQAKDFGDYKLRKFRSDIVTNLDLNVCNGYKISPATTTYVCANTPTTFSAPIGSHISYSWSNGEHTPSIIVTAFNEYSVTLTHSTLGCTSTIGPVKLARFLPSDFDDNNVTNNSDFLTLLGLFNQPCSCPQDINTDGIVNNVDFLLLLSKFNQTCN